MADGPHPAGVEQLHRLQRPPGLRGTRNPPGVQGGEAPGGHATVDVLPGEDVGGGEGGGRGGVGKRKHDERQHHLGEGDVGEGAAAGQHVGGGVDVGARGADQ